LDDLSPLGVKIPAELFDCFKSSKSGTKILDAEELALEASDLIKEIEGKPLIVSGGGILAYTLMSRFYYKRDFDTINIKRTYQYAPGEKRPRIIFSVDDKIENSRFCIDDIIASGATITQIGENLECATLLTSMQCRGEYRKKDGSTLIGVDRLYTAQGVDGIKGFPAIFSMRFITKQMAMQKDYVEYVSKYADTKKLLEIVKDIDTKPLELLYNNPIKFVQDYGG
jgi:hypothetical protein